MANRFPATQWTMIGQAGVDDTAARGAMGELLMTYQPALLAHLTRVKRIPPDRAEDLVQGFIADRVLEKDLVAHADREKGRFRTFLLTALDRYIINRVRHEQRQKRAPEGGLAPIDDLQVPAGEADGDAFDVAWAQQLLRQTVAAMRSECERTQRADVWGVFEARLLGPMLHGNEPVHYDALVAKFDLASPSQASNVLITGKRMFNRHLLAVVGEYTAGAEEAELEIAELRRVLARRAN